MGDRLGAWIFQRAALARLDGMLQKPGTDRDVAQAMSAREGLAKAAWGNELEKYVAALAEIRNRENAVRELAYDEQKILADVSAKYGIRG